MKTLKWIIAGLVPAFSCGGAMLTAGVAPDFKFWFAFVGAFVGGLAGIGVNTTVKHVRGSGGE